MKSQFAHAGSHCQLATALIITLVALWGPAALAQRQVESVLYGMWDGEQEVLLVNDDSLIVSLFDFYEVGLNPQTETATLRCTQHTLFRDGAEISIAAICTRFFLNGGVEMMLAHPAGDRWVSRTLFGTDQVENVRCEREARQETWMSRHPPMGAWRWTNHTSGTCTEVEK